jgi:hypothetical protein
MAPALVASSNHGSAPYGKFKSMTDPNDKIKSMALVLIARTKSMALALIASSNQ